MTVICILPLQSQASFDEGRFVREFRQSWPEATRPAPFRSEQSIWRTEVGESAVMLAIMPGPIPDLHLPPGILPAAWPNAQKDLLQQTAHWIVTVVGGRTSPLEDARLLTHIVHALIGSHPQILGTIWGSAGQLSSAENFRALAPGMNHDVDPILLWVDIQVVTGVASAAGPIVQGRTRGMVDFKKMELEVLDSGDNPGELQSRLLELARYILSQNALIRDGDTIGENASERIQVRFQESAFGGGQRVMRLVYPSRQMGGSGLPTRAGMANGSRAPISVPAIVSLCCAIASVVGICCSITALTAAVGIVFGHVALVTIARSKGRIEGRGLAIAALAINYLSLILGIAIMLAVYWLHLLDKPRPGAGQPEPTQAAPLQPQGTEFGQAGSGGRSGALTAPDKPREPPPSFRPVTPLDSDQDQPTNPFGEQNDPSMPKTPPSFPVDPSKEDRQVKRPTPRNQRSDPSLDHELLVNALPKISWLVSSMAVDAQHNWVAVGSSAGQTPFVFKVSELSAP